MKNFLVTMVLLSGFSFNAAIAEVKPGVTAPDFTLKDMTGADRKLSDFKGKYVVLEWFNKDCPYVKKHYGSNNMQALQKNTLIKV